MEQIWQTSTIESMALLVKIVKHGSLSAAGRALGVPKATISRRLAELERSLGTELLRRTTRSQSLTEAGQILYSQIAPLVNEIERTAAEIQVSSQEPSGLIRITASIAFGQAMLIPIVASYLELVPKVKVELALSDERLNVVGEGFDIAIRMGSLDDSELLARKLVTIERRVVASPSYIATHGRPHCIEYLKQHIAVIHNPIFNLWTFNTDKGRVETRVNWRVSTTGVLALAEAAKLGLGIALLPSFLADSAIAAGALVELDIGATPVTVDATALFHRSRTPSSAVRHFLNYLVERLSK